MWECDCDSVREDAGVDTDSGLVDCCKLPLIGIGWSVDDPRHVEVADGGRGTWGD